MSGLKPWVYREFTLTNFQFPADPQIILPFRATGIVLKIDGPSDLLWSFDGSEIDGRLMKSDQFAAFDRTDQARFWFAAKNSPRCQIRFWAWLNQ